VMQRLEQIIADGFDFGALSASEDGLPFYRARGWREWRGELFAQTPSGVMATPEERGGIFVWPGRATPEVDEALTCDWRPGDVW
jgi:aminoglycoside 2'-N-acetyltransferase I